MPLPRRRSHPDLRPLTPEQAIMNIRKLLVPVDFSAHSAEALRIAAELARRFDASLTLVHVYDPMVHALPDGFTFAAPHLAPLLDAIEHELAGAKRRVLEAGIPSVETRVLHGLAASEIVEFAKRGQVDLIVMGTSGRTGMAHLVLGSVAERVVRTANCAVLTVKSPGRPDV
jgi:universal stress protein A